MRKWYYPNKLDFVITVMVTIVLGMIGGLTWLNDVYWVFLIYIVSLGLTNLNKLSIQKIDNKNAKKRGKFKKKHLDNPQSCIKELPQRLKEIDNYFNYDSCFAALKLLLGMLAIMVLAVLSSVWKNTSIKFAEFATYFYVDAFLLPLILIFVEAFKYGQSVGQAWKELFKTLFYKNGKLKIFRGIFGLIALVFFTVFSIILTMKEFITYEYSVLVRIIIFIIGILFLIYSFYNSAKQNE